MPKTVPCAGIADTVRSVKRFLPWLVYAATASCLVASVAAYFWPGDFVVWSLMLGLLALVGLFWLVYSPMIKVIRGSLR